MTHPLHVVVLETDVVRRALLQCALPPECTATFATHLDEVADADVCIVGPNPGDALEQVCRELRQRMPIVLADERYVDETTAAQELATYRAAAAVGPPFGRESLNNALAAAMAKPRGTSVVPTSELTGLEVDLEDFQEPPTTPDRLWELFRERVETVYRNLDRLDHYQILEISPQSTMQQIKEAWKLRSLEFHPDRFAAHPNEDFRRKLYEITKAVTQAYRILSDPSARAVYDKERRPRERPAISRKLRPKREE